MDGNSRKAISRLRLAACYSLVTWMLLCGVPTRAADSCIDAPCAAFDANAAYTGDFRRNMRGGLARGNAWSGLLEAGVAWRSTTLVPGALASASASVIHVAGDGISGERVGDLQGLNNIEADAGWYLYDLWSELSFGAQRQTSVRAGLLDLNAEFDTADTNGFFVGPPFGIGTDLAQTGANGPSVFPVTALGLRVAGSFGDTLQWRVAAYEGTPGRTDRHRFATFDVDRHEGALLIGELDLAPQAGMHKLAVGAWSYTADFERIDAVARGDSAQLHGNRGAYALLDAPLLHADAVQMDGVLRAGVAAGRFNAVSRYVGVALVATHLLPGRPDDGIGIAVAHARTSREFRNQLAFDGGRPARSETAVELTLRAAVADWLALVPSAQWIGSPGADHARRAAFVAGLRIEASLQRSSTTLARAPPPRSSLHASTQSHP